MEARGRQILATRPQDLPHNLRTNFSAHLADRIALHEQHGFEHIRTYYQMRRDLNQPIPQLSLPASLHLTKYTPELDQAVMNTVNEAFTDHWGHIPLTEKIWKLFYTSSSDFRPDLTYVAQTIEGEVAGICFNEVREAENQAFGIRQGWIRILAVRRPWRRQGIGTALLCIAMQAFKDSGMDLAGLGVDAENLTGALKLYEDLDFTVFRRFLAYGKTISPEEINT
jgi:ribosomal protein S18 acetylase RimI-like enzyme